MDPFSKQWCQNLLKKASKWPLSIYFVHPVDPNYAQGYFDVVKTPMDIDTMNSRLDNNEYRSDEEFINDIKLISSNAAAYNGQESLLTKMANDFQAKVLKSFSKKPSSAEEEWVKKAIKLSRKFSDHIKKAPVEILPSSVPPLPRNFKSSSLDDVQKQEMNKILGEDKADQIEEDWVLFSHPTRLRLLEIINMK